MDPAKIVLLMPINKDQYPHTLGQVAFYSYPRNNTIASHSRRVSHSVCELPTVKLHLVKYIIKYNTI